jgi:hypothetical protein
MVRRAKNSGMNPNNFQRLAWPPGALAAIAGGPTDLAENEKRWKPAADQRQKLHGRPVTSSWPINEQGRFPPSIDAAQTWAAEEQYRATLPGMDAANLFRTEMRKPFWMGAYYVEHFSALIHIFRRCDFMPPRKLLELGCGSGWMAEFLALGGYDVTATSLLHRI